MCRAVRPPPKHSFMALFNYKTRFGVPTRLPVKGQGDEGFMSEANQGLAARLQERFAGRIVRSDEDRDKTTEEKTHNKQQKTMRALRDEPAFAFDQMMDLCGVDYLGYGESTYAGPRFAVVYHLLSVRNNQRLRVKVL